MDITGMSFKAIGRQMGYHYTVGSRLVRKHTQINHPAVGYMKKKPALVSPMDLTPCP
jgi:hypothetical protein